MNNVTVTLINGNNNLPLLPRPARVINIYGAFIRNNYTLTRSYKNNYSDASALASRIHRILEERQSQARFSVRGAEQRRDAGPIA